MNVISENIKKLRKAKGMTQEELAEKTNVSYQAVSKWENGGSPDIEMLPILANTFGVTIDELMGFKLNSYTNKEKCDLDVPDIARQRVEGFEFCGFDLSDFVVSAILNCGSFTTGDYFSKAFDYRKLNKFGLIPDYKTAIEVRSKLMEEYQEDGHAYCAIFAIWRRI